MNGMILHSGGKVANRGELDLITLPEQTESYTPVSHYHLANKLLTVSQDLLSDYALVGENYALARQGNQMFAILKFQRKDEKGELGLSFAFRNSYDRSMSLGFACGASAWICDNLALEGKIVVMKKHTKNVWDSLENDAITTLYKANQSFLRIEEDAGKMKSVGFHNEQAFRAMGLLFGKDIISPRQLTVLKDQWLKPAYDEFQPRNLWSFYNACTHSLKTTPPVYAMEKRVQLHETIIDAEFTV
jgi:hypothetical protein